MQSFTRHQGLVMPLNRANVDTDAIIPKQYLKSIERTGFGVTLFDDWRYLDEGSPESDHSARRINPDFIINQHDYQNASILLAQENFGCGSSREHAVWALDDFGFRVVLAPSFADIFFSNSFKSGLLPIVIQQDKVDALFGLCANNPDYMLTVDLEAQQIKGDNFEHAFEVDEFRKYCLINGLDDIGLTLQHEDEIRAFEQQRMQAMPWFYTLG